MEIIKSFTSNPLWGFSFFNNTVVEYVIFISSVILLSLGFFVLKRFLLKKVPKLIKKKNYLQVFLDVLSRVRSPFYIFIALYISLPFLQLPELLLKVFFLALVFWAPIKVVTLLSLVVDFILSNFLEKKASEGSVAMIRATGNIAKGALWIFAGMIVLSLLGINVTGLMAGMGIGGIAIAFALQGILSDLFSSFSLYFDKPFIEGDFIVVNDTWGTVERIGIKSTRIRSIQGEEIILSNKELTSAKVHNMKRMTRRRAEFDIGITYETPTKKMEKINSIIKKIVDKENDATFDRLHFHNFGNFSLNYKLIYFVESPDFVLFMDINERVLLNIKRAFEKEGINFAYPTSTVRLVK